MGPCVTFSRIKENFFDSSTFAYTGPVTRLHSSSDSSTVVYTCLVTRLHSPSDSSVLAYICLESSVTCLHLSRLFYTQLVSRLYFRVDQRKERFHKVLFGMISGKNDEKLLSFSHRTKDGV